MNRDTNLANFALNTIVELAVVKHQLHIVHEVLDARVLVLLKLCLDGGEIHWVLDKQRVVGDSQLHIVDGLSKNVRLRIALKICQHSLCSLFPLIKDGSAVRHFWNL